MAPGYLLAQIIAGFTLSVLVMGGLALFLQWKRWRRKIEGERPPQREKIMRPPGHFAMLRLDQLREDMLFIIAQTAAAACVLGLFLLVFFDLISGLLAGRIQFSELTQLKVVAVLLPALLMCLAAALWVIRCFLRVSRLDEDIRNWRFGLRGEQAVAEKLNSRELASAGYAAFHDLPGDGNWNVDHVVVGPGGVFVLETKAETKRKPTRDQAPQDVFFDGNPRFPLVLRHHAVPQAERNARWVRNLLKRFPLRSPRRADRSRARLVCKTPHRSPILPSQSHEPRPR